MVMENLYFAKPMTDPAATFTGIGNLATRDIYIGGQLTIFSGEVR
jgi:hypothetical protein